MRLIDADELKKYICGVCNNRERCEDRETVCSEIADIDEQPTIEAEPVKHGTWEYGSDCSVCGISLNTFVADIFDFCPYCGARMDGDTHD